MTQNDKLQTRRNEVRFITSDLAKMRGYYLANDLYKIWQEAFLDEDNGEVVMVDRRELLIKAGTKLDLDKLQEVQFYMQTGDIEEVEVTNQLRIGILSEKTYLNLWSVTVSVNERKKKLLLYAVSPDNALEIATDYVELHYKGYFYFTQVKAMDFCIFIEEPAIKPKDGEEWEFYKIEVEVAEKDHVSSYTFILPAKDVDNGMITINDLISKQYREKQEKEGGEPVEFTTTVKAGGTIPCNSLIPQAFSEAYRPQE